MDSKYDALKEAIIDGEVEAALAATDQLLDSGVAPMDIINDCMQDTLNEMGEQFGKLEIFLPELILASDVVKAVQDKLMPLLAASKSTSTVGRAIIGTAYGDLHDIGKNMVSLMMEVNGFAVRDLGTSVEAKAFVEAAEDFNADLILISALMLPSLPYMQDTIDLVKGNSKLRERIRVLVGGGPVNQMWADEIGADGYANDALEGVARAKELMASIG